jgi:hypothetical protein
MLSAKAPGAASGFNRGRDACGRGELTDAAARLSDAREMAMARATDKWLALSLIALGCGGSQAEAPAASSANEVKEKAASAASGPINSVSKHGSSSVALLLGTGGGTLELDEGPRVMVPPGTVKAGQEFVLKVAPKTTAFSNKESEKPLGPTFAFAPGIDASSGEGIEISYPLGTLPKGWGEPSIAYEVQEGAEITYGENSTRTSWQYERAKLTGGRVVAHLASVDGLRMQFVLTNLEAQ